MRELTAAEMQERSDLAVAKFLAGQRERAKLLRRIGRGGVKHPRGATKPLPGRDKAKAKAQRAARKRNR